MVDVLILVGVGVVIGMVMKDVVLGFVGKIKAKIFG